MRTWEFTPESGDWQALTLPMSRTDAQEMCGKAATAASRRIHSGRA